MSTTRTKPSNFLTVYILDVPMSDWPSLVYHTWRLPPPLSGPVARKSIAAVHSDNVFLNLVRPLVQFSVERFHTWPLPKQPLFGCQGMAASKWLYLTALTIRFKDRPTCSFGGLTSCGVWPSPEICQLGIDTLSDDTLIGRQYLEASMLTAFVTFFHFQSLNYQLRTGPQQQLPTTIYETGSSSRSKSWTRIGLIICTTEQLLSSVTNDNVFEDVAKTSIGQTILFLFRRIKGFIGAWKQAFDNADGSKAKDNSNYTVTDLSRNRYSCRGYIDRMSNIQWRKRNGMSYANIWKIHGSLGRGSVVFGGWWEPFSHYSLNNPWNARATSRDTWQYRFFLRGTKSLNLQCHEKLRLSSGPFEAA